MAQLKIDSMFHTVLTAEIHIHQRTLLASSVWAGFIGLKALMADVAAECGKRLLFPVLHHRLDN